MTFQIPDKYLEGNPTDILPGGQPFGLRFSDSSILWNLSVALGAGAMAFGEPTPFGEVALGPMAVRHLIAAQLKISWNNHLDSQIALRSSTFSFKGGGIREYIV